MAVYWTLDDFKEYVRSQLNCWRKGRDGATLDVYPISDSCWEEDTESLEYRWVFWSRDHDNPIPPLTSPHDKIILALRQVLFFLDCTTLLQFWAVTTLEGRTLLTTHNQPFALTSFNKGLCEYRMISMDYKFYVDGQSEEEDLGLPGRVFMNKLPHCTPNVEYYSPKEHPLRNHALRCGVRQSWALPVLEQSSQICIGVLEVVGDNWFRPAFVKRLYAIFQSLSLQCFEACKHREEMREKDKDKAHKDAYTEIWRVLKVVCGIHRLPFAQMWVPCRTCNALLQGLLLPSGQECFNVDNSRLLDFSSVSYGHHITSGKGVVGSALSSPTLLYCSDVTQFSLADYPLAHYAQWCGLRGCFVISLHSNYTRNAIYVLEIFLRTSNKDSEDLVTTLRNILGTVKKEFKTFNLASGEELGEEPSIEVIEFQNSQELRYVVNCGTNVSSTEQCDIDVNRPPKLGPMKTSGREHKNTGVRIENSDILDCSNMSREDAAKKLEVSTSTFKRACTKHDISRWPPHVDKVRPPRLSRVDHQEEISQLNSKLPSNQASDSVAHTKTRDTAVQNINTVTVRAKYVKNITIKFQLSLSAGLVELQQEVAKRLKLEAGSYYIKYKDEEDELILIACDEDLQECVQFTRSPGSNSIVVFLVPK